MVDSSDHPVSGVASARDLLAMCDRLAVPHFQRVLVWDSSSVALLLESLYHSTPCGSIVFWKPPNAGTLGVPLTVNGDTLIVDGQQRIRSLHGVFSNTKVASPGMVDGGEGEDDSEDVP